MREINSSVVTATVARLAEKANYELSSDVLGALNNARVAEKSMLGREILDLVIENASHAPEIRKPLCQDCGVAVVFIDIGQEVHISGGDLESAVKEGVRKGYGEGFLRKSMVASPFTGRNNTGDNSPPVIYYRIVPGDRLKISVMAKGSGAENMSRLFMLKPAEGRSGVIEAAVRAVEEAGGKPCPPIIIGIGIGGTAEESMLMAKRSLLRKVGQPSEDVDSAALERDILDRVNKLGIGPLGLGGSVTALAVHVESMPCHIASLPVAINLQCHSARHKEAEI
ncbi:fumarate hydratase subunit alpha [Dehalogenimonas formicexedens]|uniref:Fumarate hydratase subunit alpha n=1 Tax=Dehalogenimonas formicexedens TaxID=1839801 RepID=A0A1P8F7Y0_9CHLR|nr:fumarate hydratase [Dehalogenimonas formicexedens]APV44581.1 fumarate hydratase subunit alpha [Dehalogenimonas formicexedens]